MTVPLHRAASCSASRPVSLTLLPSTMMIPPSFDGSTPSFCATATALGVDGSGALAPCRDEDRTACRLFSNPALSFGTTGAADPPPANLSYVCFVSPPVTLGAESSIANDSACGAGVLALGPRSADAVEAGCSAAAGAGSSFAGTSGVGGL